MCHIQTPNPGHPTPRRTTIIVSFTGLSPSEVFLSRKFNSLSQVLFFTTSLPTFAGDSVCLVPYSLAATRGITIMFSSPTGTKMFQFPVYAFIVRCHTTNLYLLFRIRKSRDQSLHAAPSRLSQLATSVIAI